MSPEVFREFEKILSKNVVGNSILEIGAVPTTDSLLNIAALSDATDKIGINLDGGTSYSTGEPSTHNAFEIVSGNANDMSRFDSNRFDTVLCNSVIEHDKYFWKTMAEVRRVAKAGALIVIASPGFDDLQKIRSDSVNDEEKIAVAGRLGQMQGSTLTMRIHNWPGDYYRFSPQAYKEIIFEGMQNVQVYSIMIPPRIFGIGFNQK